MKRILFFTLALLFALSCRKEEGNLEYYNRDGSPVTWEQARDITENLWSLFDYVVISEDILPPSTRIKQPLADQVIDPYYSPDYDSWVVVMSPDPASIDGIRIYHYAFVNAKTGEVYIDPIEREIDYDSMEWRDIKIPNHASLPGLQYPIISKVSGLTINPQ